MHQTAARGVMGWGPCLSLAIEKNQLVTKWVLLISLIVLPSIFIHLTSALWPRNHSTSTILKVFPMRKCSTGRLHPINGFWLIIYWFVTTANLVGLHKRQTAVEIDFTAQLSFIRCSLKDLGARNSSTIHKCNIIHVFTYGNNYWICI